MSKLPTLPQEPAMIELAFNVENLNLNFFAIADYFGLEFPATAEDLKDFKAQIAFELHDPIVEYLQHFLEENDLTKERRRHA